jgi:dihydroorotase
MRDTFDLLLAGGTLLDPASGIHGQMDLGITDGRIAATGPGLVASRAERRLDVRGCYVTPGLVDFHLHSYWGVNPYGVDVDRTCLQTGVTTAVDAGSAGPVNFLGFERFIAERSTVRMLAFVSVAQHGVLRSPGELVDLAFADAEGAAETVRAHPDVAVGIKVRLEETAAGENGRRALGLALQAGEAARAPVMVHTAPGTMSMEEIAEALRPGDIITHCFTPLQPSIVDERGRLRPAVRQAHERGVLLDVGHGGRHLAFAVVASAMREGLLPDMLSTDLHSRLSDPSLDLPLVMSKFLALGLSLEHVIAACTCHPARAIGREDRLGVLAVGREADVSVLEVVEGPVTLRDSTGAELATDRRVAARWTIRRGQVFEASDRGAQDAVGSG